MPILATTVLFFVLFPSSVSSTSCDATGISTKQSSCIGSIGSASGSTCEKWNTGVCCLNDEFSSCGETIGGMIIEYYTSKLAAVLDVVDASDCPTVSCSGGGGAPAPAAAVESILDAMIELADPTKFNETKYIEALKSKTGASADPIAVVKAWEIIVEYVVPSGTTDDQLKAAVVTALGLLESAITIATPSGGRRLSLDREVTVTTTNPDTIKAKELMDKASGAAALASLTDTLGASVTAKTPKAKVEVETKIMSTKSETELKADLESADIETAAGGKVTAIEKTGSSEVPETGGSVRSGIMVLTSITFALAAGYV